MARGVHRPTVTACALLIAVAAIVAAPARAETLVDLQCAAKLVGGGCAGIDLSQKVVLRDPFDEVPEFCNRPECIAEAGDGICDGSKVGGVVTGACGLIDCLKPVFATCKTTPCSTECQDSLDSDACAPFQGQLGLYGVDRDQLGPGSPVCLGNRCAEAINGACNGNFCSEECGTALGSPECVASPGKIPEKLKPFVGGPRSKACFAQECAARLLSACGSLIEDDGSVPEITELACSQGCADAFATEACQESDYAGSAALLGPTGTLCTADACLGAISEPCGTDNLETLDFSVVAGTLPKLCSEECKAKVDSPGCSAVAGYLSDLVGPDSQPCEKAECLLSVAFACQFEPADDAQEYLNLYPVSQICSADPSSACREAVAAPGCGPPGVQGAFESFCECTPRVLEDCGLDLSGPAQPWNEVVANGRFCTPGCEALLKGQEAESNGACAKALPGILQDGYDFLCGCGAKMTEACDPLTGPGPFSDQCCQSALSDSCFMKEPVQELLPKELMQSLVDQLPAESLSGALNATLALLADSPFPSLVPDNVAEAARNAVGAADTATASFYSDVANVVQSCSVQGFEPVIEPLTGPSGDRGVSLGAEGGGNNLDGISFGDESAAAAPPGGASTSRLLLLTAVPALLVALLQLLW